MIEYKDIKGYEGLYKVSNTGMVYSTPRKGTKGGVLPPIKEEYYSVVLCKKMSCKKHKIHRLVAQAFIENPNNHKMINHKDCNKYNNNLSNLEWCNNSENIKHAYDNNLIRPKRGSLNGMSKLNENQVKEIRDYAKKNPSKHRSFLSEKYNISKATIKDIVSRRRNVWPHV
jgi:hypothetical protein